MVSEHGVDNGVLVWCQSEGDRLDFRNSQNIQSHVGVLQLTYNEHAAHIMFEMEKRGLQARDSSQSTLIP